MLEVSKFSAGYGSKTVLKEISFSLEQGRITGLLGGNGCGKTTLLKAICGILPYEGNCRADGKEIRLLNDRERGLVFGYIPQKSGILANLTLMEVVLMGFYARLKLLEQPNTAMRQAAEEALRFVGLENMAGKGFQTLSEGQKQLCILARTLVENSRVLLLDEPESALDFEHRYRMMELLKQQTSRQDSLALISLHDPQLALNSCDKVLLLKDGGITGIITPGKEELPVMNEKLREIYGNVSLHTVPDRSGKPHFVMVKE